MAAKKSAVSGNVKDNLPKPPKGFRRVTTPDIDGWLVGEKGQTIEGKLVGLLAMETENGERECLLIELSKPALGKNTGEKETRTMSPGEIGALGINKTLKSLKAYVRNQGNVWILCHGKKDIGDGRSMWAWEGYSDGEPATPPAAVSGGQSSGDDDIPF